MIKKFVYVYSHAGLDGIVYTLLKKMGFDISFLSIIEKKKKNIEKKIALFSKNRVLNGIYKNIYLYYNHRWGGYGSKLLGCYELQVQEKIKYIKKKYNLKFFVNFGAGEGYHVIGQTKNVGFKESVAFEISNNAKNILIRNLKKNKVFHKVKVFSKASFLQTFNYLGFNNLKKTIFLIDIEGAEYDLIKIDNLNYFKNSYLIIEDHNFWIKDKSKIKKFNKILKKNFKIEILKNSSRNPFECDGLRNISDDERWLTMSENRPLEMQWLICTPR